MILGSKLERAKGPLEGISLETWDSFMLGMLDQTVERFPLGFVLGAREGWWLVPGNGVDLGVCLTEGILVGFEVGLRVGSGVGSSVGRRITGIAVGFMVGLRVGAGSKVGLGLGSGVGGILSSIVGAGVGTNGIWTVIFDTLPVGEFVLAAVGLIETLLVPGVGDTLVGEFESKTGGEEKEVMGLDAVAWGLGVGILLGIETGGLL